MKEKQTEEEEGMRHLRIVEKNNKINKRTTIEKKKGERNIHILRKKKKGIHPEDGDTQ